MKSNTYLIFLTDGALSKGAPRFPAGDRDRTYKMTTASHKASIKASQSNGRVGFTYRTLLGLLSELAFLAEIPGHWEISHGPYKHGRREWIKYPVPRDEYPPAATRS